LPARASPTEVTKSTQVQVWCRLKVKTLLASLLLVVSGAKGTPLRDATLRSETVRLSVEGRLLRVIGTYEFVRGDRLEDLQVLFPIIEAAPLGPPRITGAAIRSDHGARHRLNLTQTEMGPSWILPFSTSRSCEVTVQYEQPLSANRAEYVLTTARGWPEPIRRAKVEISLPARATLTHASYLLQTRDGPGATKVSSLEEQNFTPDRDFVVEWSDP
jgi:hypothetical protein